MENRITKNILEFIHSEWKLSLDEEAVVEGFLNLLAAQDKVELNKIRCIIDDDTVELLMNLNSREVIDFAMENANLIDRGDEYDLVEALEDLDYDFSDNISLDDHIEIVEDHGYTVIERENKQTDIVSEIQLEEWLDLFSKLSVQEREEILCHKGIKV